MAQRRKDGGVEAPLSLSGFFYDPNEEEEGEEGNRNEQFEQIYDEQTLTICQKDFRIRQYCWHQANANKVWPGTFNLAEFIEDHSKRFQSGNILELGAATGALSIYLKAVFPEYQLWTSDIDDGGEVEENIKYNFEINGLSPLPHIPHTWGAAWPEEKLPSTSIRYIFASDILLYVSAYPALVRTLLTLFYDPESATSRVALVDASLSTPGPSDESLAPYVINLSSSDHEEISYDLYDSGVVAFTPHLRNINSPSSSCSSFSSLREQIEYPREFLMSWNRRISESYKFFQMMREAGFVCYHHGKCIYSFIPTR